MQIDYERPLGYPPFYPNFAFNILRKSGYRQKEKLGGRIMRRCFPNTAGFEHILDYLVTGVGFLEVPLEDGAMGLTLMFPVEHGCFAINDGKTVRWGRWTYNGLLVGTGEYMLTPDGHVCAHNALCLSSKGADSDTTRPSAFYATPRSLPARLQRGDRPAPQREFRLPQGNVRFRVIRDNDELQEFGPFINRIGRYLRPGVRYAFTPPTGEEGVGLMLLFWGDRGCFVGAKHGCSWGKWLESENSLHCGGGWYISAVDGKSHKGLSRYDNRLKRYVADLLHDYAYIRPLPDEDKAPELWQAMLANLSDPNFC